MKRSKFVNLLRLRKNTRQAIKPLSLAITAALVGCSSSSGENVIVLNSVDDCVANTSFNQEQCTMAYQQALNEAEKTAPKYSSRDDCEAEFGNARCQQNGSGSFTPFMSGYMVSSALSRYNDQRYYHPVYTYHYTYQGFRGSTRVLADGTQLKSMGNGRYKAPTKISTQAMPIATRTISRGGFGSKASAKASWGTSRSSGSWGG